MTRCKNCKQEVHGWGGCDNPYVITKKDVDWAIRTFYKVKEQILEEEFFTRK